MSGFEFKPKKVTILGAEHARSVDVVDEGGVAVCAIRGNVDVAGLGRRYSVPDDE
jgi:hypothetical protein